MWNTSSYIASRFKVFPKLMIAIQVHPCRLEIRYTQVYLARNASSKTIWGTLLVISVKMVYILAICFNIGGIAPIFHQYWQEIFLHFFTPYLQCKASNIDLDEMNIYK